MSDRRQFVLELGHRPRHAAEDFLVSDSNRVAWHALQGEAAWPQCRMVLHGPSGSGKTHLATAWSAERGGIAVAAAEIGERGLAAAARAEALVVEGADTLSALPKPARRDLETTLLHLVNLAAAERVPLLLTARRAAGRWAVGLPDLASRLAATTHVAMGPPDDQLLTNVLRKLFRDRQQTVGDDVLECLVWRMERSFAEARELVVALDRRALAQRRRITRALAADVLSEREAAVRREDD